jgi:hypothetical protein
LEGSLRVVVVLLFVVLGWEPLVALPPHPATAKVAATVASSVSMAASGIRFIGRPPVVARTLRGSPYQAYTALAEAG